MTVETHSQLANFIWSICNLLRGPYKRNEYRKVILPMTVLRRFDCLLAPTKTQALAEHPKIKTKPDTVVRSLLEKITGRPFYNLSKLDLPKLLDDPTIQEMGEWYLEEELPLRLAFADVIRESPFPGVGGFSFTLLGSPLGHCYISDGGFFAWDSVKIGQIPTPDYRHFEKTGTTHYQFSLTSPQQRGAGVTGAFLPQIALGFIYSPLQSDQVFHRPGVTLEDLSSEVNQIAAELICSSELTA